MLALTSQQRIKAQVLKGASPRAKLVIKNLTSASGLVQDVDISSFVNNWGTISRRLTFDIGNFTPGNHSWTFANTKDLATFFFTFGQQFGKDFWMDKEYDLLYGFFEPMVVATDRADRELLHFFTGLIQDKVENRVNGQISINAKDLSKEMLDFKLCTLLEADQVFDNQNLTIDGRGFQQILKYGLHRLVSTESDKSQWENRNNPFTAVVCHPNLVSASPKSVGSNRDRFLWWYCPTQNGQDEIYTSADPLTKEVYYWDYRDDQKRWVRIADADRDSLTIQSSIIAGVNGFFIGMTAGFTPTNSEWPAASDWDDYLNATSNWTVSGDAAEVANKLDPAVCVETKSFTTAADLPENPVLIISKLLQDFIGYTTGASGQIDQSTAEFTALNKTFSFDAAFSFFSGGISGINISYDKQTSVFQVIQDIVKLTGMYFFTGSKKSLTSDRRVRLVVTGPVNLCDPLTGAALVLPLFSTRERVKAFTHRTSKQSVFDKATTTNFDEQTSTKDTFDVKTFGTGDKVIQFASQRNPNVYWFSSPLQASSNSQRRFSQLSQPAEEINLTLDLKAFPLELADLIRVHDQISGNTIVTQIFEQSINLDSGLMNLKTRRYTKFFGPDESDSTKLWAFIDCSYVDADVDGNTYHVF